MKRTITAIALSMAAATGVAAQHGQQGSHNPALKDPAPHQLSAPAHGRNSFTEDQARGRLMKAGFTGVSKLTKDGNGVWRGTGMRGGQKTNVGVDYKGNVTR